MSYLDLDHAKIYYETAGDQGQWVTLVNGHMRSHKDFRVFTKQLVQAGYRVLIFDNRGVGNSSNKKPFTLNDLANDVLELWDHLQVGQSHLLGISMGGAISQIIASQLPEQVLRLILVSTTAHEKWFQTASEQDWGTDPDTVESKLRQYFAENFVDKNQLLIQAMAKQMAKDLQNPAYQQGAALQKNAMRNLDLTSYTRKIQAKTLILHGLEDQVIHPDAACELAELIADSKLELIPGVGHLLLAEYAKSLYSKTIQFLS